MKHPQANSLEEFIYRVLLRGIRQRLDNIKGNYVKELPHVLWAYKTTPHSSTREAPFPFTYDTKDIIPIEIRELSWIILHPLPREDNKEGCKGIGPPRRMSRLGNTEQSHSKYDNDIEVR